MTEPVRTTHYSDLLCIWAYVAQTRYDELLTEFGDRVRIEYRYMSVFGSVRAKLAEQWSERGGAAGYGAHVREVASGFEHVEVHPEVWVAATPESSMPGHLYLCVVRELESRGEIEPGAQARAAWAVRKAFFRECADIGRLALLLEIGERAGVPAARVEPLFADGTAHAALAGDLAEVRERAVRASPTLTLNEDRQRLTGNVGYRVIEANVRELLERPAGQSSWC